MKRELKKISGKVARFTIEIKENPVEVIVGKVLRVKRKIIVLETEDKETCVLKLKSILSFMVEEKTK